MRLAWVSSPLPLRCLFWKTGLVLVKGWEFKGSFACTSKLTVHELQRCCSRVFRRVGIKICSLHSILTHMLDLFLCTYVCTYMKRDSRPLCQVNLPLISIWGHHSMARTLDIVIKTECIVGLRLDTKYPHEYQLISAIYYHYICTCRPNKPTK